ncbi:helix-turn-helix domain-containing protein [Polaribacter aestuariivivens]|uniref:helix-turn-helix domain-containing protein n=1 Tax=Polaribacter aestuariivivens TaxID=2304626 RepID=UPI003F49867D
MITLNENISYLIDKNRFNQEEFAEILSVSRAVVSSWINGKGNPKYDKLLLISEKFNVSVDNLLKKDLSKENNNIGLLGAKPIPEITLYKDSVQEAGLNYTSIAPEFKNKVLALLLKDTDIKKALLQVIKDSINIK